MFWKRQQSKEEKILTAAKIILWLAPVALLVFVLNKHFVPSGELTVRYQVGKGSPLVRNFASKEPDKLIGTKNKTGETDYFQQITVSPLYFDVKVPRPFRRATVTMKYQNPQSQPVIQLGVQQANKAYATTTMANVNTTLDTLPVYWELIQEGDIYLWQKNSQYYTAWKEKQKVFEARKKRLEAWKETELAKVVQADQQSIIEEKYQAELDKITEERRATRVGTVPFSSIQDFLAALPSREEVVQYQYDLSPYFELPGYVKSNRVMEITKSIRGKHEIYTYVGNNEDLNFIMTAQDINRHVGADDVTVTAYGPSGSKIKTVTAADDGEINASGRVLPERLVKVLIENIPHGVYRLVIDANDDTFIKKIVTFQHFVMFRGGVYLTDNLEYHDIVGDGPFTATALYTNSSVVRARTAHEAGLQTVRVGNRDLKIDERHVLEEAAGLRGVTMLATPKNDVYIEGDGFFAFSKDQLFDPNALVAMSFDTIKDIDDYSYIIATYPQARKDGDWLVASATVEAPPLYFDRGADLLAHFIIGLPDLHEKGRILKVKEITVAFEKEPVTPTNFFSRAKNWFKRAVLKQ